MDQVPHEEAKGLLAGLFHNLGNARQQNDPSLLGGGMAQQVEEFMTMPVDIAMIFTQMGVDLAEMVLQALAEAGVVLVKGLTPA